MIRMSACTTAIALVLVSLLPAPTAYGAGGRDLYRITAEGEGEAEIEMEDLPRARNDALEDALRKAFENALVEILPMGVTLAGRQDIMDQLASRLKRYLLQYRVLSEMPALQVYFLNVEATFSVPLIREDLVKMGLAWTEEGTVEPVEFFLRIEGVASIAWYQQLLQVFEKMARVNRATPYEVFGSSLVLRLEYEGDVNALLEAISNVRSEDFALRVEQVKESEITVSLVTMLN